jgi:GNAT superfamily N-acetyltransferase
VKLWRRVGVAPGPTDTLPDARRLLAHTTATVVVAEAGGALVGAVAAAFDGRRGSLYRLAVHPAHRRRSCARALVAAAEQRLAGWGARRLTALVERGRPGAMAFWAAGYLPEPELLRHVRTPAAALRDDGR